MKLKAEHYLIITLIIITILQAIFTPVIGDEAYYWMYAQQLDTGYFDHPPMVAWLIALGNIVFSSNFGLRICSIILSIAAYYLLWTLIPKKAKDHPKAILLYLLLVIAIPICNLYSFITTPDAALLFFTVVYLKVFNRFLNNQNIINGLLLGISAALLMYTKYHGALVIILTLIPHLKLFKSIHFYTATLVGIILYIPHILWQIEHDFVTFKFHLIDRADKSFKIKNVINYILATILVLNPILVVTFINQKLKKNNSLKYSKHYYYLFYGGLIFFLISSFRDKIEPHWIFFTVVPFILFSYPILIKNYNKSFIKYGLGFVVVLLLSFRVIAMTPSVFEGLLIKDDKTVLEFHKEGKAYFETIDSLANGLPVVFVNSYQKASKYAFYTSNPSFSANNFFYRKNQYDLWNFDTLKNKEVLFIGNYPHTFMDSLAFKHQEPIYYTSVRPFHSFINVTSEIVSIKKTDEITYSITFSIKNDNPYPISLIDDIGTPYRIVVKKDGKSITALGIDTPNTTLPSRESLTVTGTFKTSTPITNCEYFLTIKQLDKHYITIGKPKAITIAIRD